jgi:hypothetical protein
LVKASQSCSTPRRKHKPRPPRARMAGREPRAKTRMKRRAAGRARHGLLDRHFIRKMRRILQQGRKLGISEQRLRELTVIAAGRIGKRLQQAMAKELLREPWPAEQRPKQRLWHPSNSSRRSMTRQGLWWKLDNRPLLERSCGIEVSLLSANFEILPSGNTTHCWPRRCAQPR